MFDPSPEQQAHILARFFIALIIACFALVLYGFGRAHLDCRDKGGVMVNTSSGWKCFQEDPAESSNDSQEF